MYEITHQGAWFKWSALDAAEKRLSGLSIVTATVPGAVAGLWVGSHAYRLGFALGSGRPAPKESPLDALLASQVFDALVLAAVACSLISGIAWWRFSRRQDEMFNRVQNYAIGQAGAWCLAGAALWWLLSLSGLTGPLPLGWFVHIGLVLVLAFWFRAVRRWA